MRKIRRGGYGKKTKRHYKKQGGFLQRLKRFFDILAE